jgi:uncharacterized cupredoxin-like copper-binding protein
MEKSAMNVRVLNLLSVSAFALSLAALPLAPVALAAGDHAGGHGHAADIGKPGEPSEASRTVEVTMWDNYYEPESIEVSEGETVHFVVRNEGELVHEFNIGTAAMHAAHQDEMMMMIEHGVIDGDHINHDMMKMDMGNGHTMEHDDPNSVLLEPGQSAEIVWTFTTDADLEFACNVPGHYDAGMMGEIDIEG